MGWGAVAGAVLGSAFNTHSANQAWKHQKEYAQNAHQWEVADLRKAGLNPILSAGGQGASMASVASAQDPGFASAGASIDNNNLARKSVESEIEERDARIENLSKQNESLSKQIEKTTADISLANASVKEKDEIIKRYQTENEFIGKQYIASIQQANANTAKALAERDVAQAKYDNVVADTDNKKVSHQHAKALTPAYEKGGKYIKGLSDWVDDGITSAKDKFNHIKAERLNYGYSGMD